MTSLFNLFRSKKHLTTDALNAINKGLNALQTDALGKYLEYFPNGAKLSIAIVNKDSLTFVGITRAKNSLIYYDDKDAVFEIGSITKVFTSILLSMFVSDGLIKLDDPIKNYFDFPLKQSSLNGKEITLENLANHTSGLPRIDFAMLLGKGSVGISNPYKNYGEEKLMGYLKNRMKLKTIPGTKFNYSNLGGGLLAFILCKKANKTYEALLQEYIFTPFNMAHSTTDLSKVKQELVKGLTKKGAIAENWNFTDASAGAGAIKSTSVDMAHFIQAHFSDNKMLQLPLQKTFAVKENINIGLAWLIEQKNGRTIYWHNGGTGGYRSSIAMDLSNRKGIVLLSNVSALHPQNKNIDELCFSLLESIE